MSATSTPESANVGIITHHTLRPLITNKYGAYGAKDPNELSGWNVVSADEALIPFISEIYSDRATLATRHTQQTTPVNNSEPPLVITGGEFIIPQIASSRFCQKAKDAGVVVEVIPNETMTVEYKDGSRETIDIIPRKSRTKRGSFISLELRTPPVGHKFRKNELLAYTKNFDGKTGMYTSGKNINIAVMNYLGFGHEDGYVISKNLADETTTDVVKEIHLIIPPETKVLKVEGQIGKMTERGEILVEFSYDDDLEEYLQAYELDLELEDGENVISGGKSSIKLPSPGGEIIDIKVQVNDKLKSDKQLIELHKDLVNRIENIKSRLEKGKRDSKDKIRAVDNLDTKFFKVGGQKYKGQEFKGIRVSYLIKVPKSLRVGDKLASR
jgi:DNA-directed RNA polymerase beta subunit